MDQQISPNKNDDRVVGAAAIAAALGVKTSTVYCWSATSGAPGGGLTIHQAANGRLYCYKAELDEYARRYAIAPAPEKDERPIDFHEIKKSAEAITCSAFERGATWAGVEDEIRKAFSEDGEFVLRLALSYSAAWVAVVNDVLE